MKTVFFNTAMKHLTLLYAESKVKPQKKLINGCKIFHKPVSLAISALKSVTGSLVHPASTSSRPERSWLAHFATLSLGFCLILKV